MSNPVIELEIQQLQDLAKESDFFSVPDVSSDRQRITLRFQGKFIAGIAGAAGNVVEPRFNDEQTIEISIPDGFPESGPGIRWLSPIFHPNIPASGEVQFADIGLHWDRQMNLSIVCERLWDIARWAYVEPMDAANSNAGNWFTKKINVQLPLDNRRLSSLHQDSSANIFSYRRKRRSGVAQGSRSKPLHRTSQHEGSQHETGDNEIHFID